MRRILIGCWFLLSSFMCQGYEIQIVTEDFAPYSYKENGKLTGISVEIVESLLEQLNLPSNIRVYPFKRTIELAKTRKNTLIFSIIRSEERERHFKWVGRLAPITTALFKLKQRTDINIQSIEDIAEFRISDIQGSAVWEHLKRYDIEVLEIPSTAQNIQMLKLGRIDLTSTVELNFYHTLRVLDYSPKEFEVAYVFDELSSHLWLAFNKDTDDKIVEDFREALQTFKTSVMFKSLLKKYNPNLND
ncbi:substrate-binding periplasmic protein [Litoribrevibacter albus]|uniref:Solute-binding protein family 3/N-terminal domain-containing protein n=1 Tax=Litoribrevibacter albus TaxID=1473156 RepID=A0AA37SAY5_9GAMM|nr:transporter substrate-binding domain-containing protein [Litoribrevibacter albus]GLQ31098.1 hypothetical protein GCM10007876_15770 [Litoribrevibacter albus]